MRTCSPLAAAEGRAQEVNALTGVIFDSAARIPRNDRPRVRCRHARAARAGLKNPGQQAALKKHLNTLHRTPPNRVAESLHPGAGVAPFRRVSKLR